MTATDTIDKKTDVLNADQRSYCMSRVRDRDTKPEIRLRKALWAKGLRYRVRYCLPGKPDIAFPGKKIAVFVDGCFWHGCPVHFKLPKTNSAFWGKKIQNNIQRDQEVTRQLSDNGWTVIRIREHEIKDDLDWVVKKIQNAHYKILE